MTSTMYKKHYMDVNRAVYMSTDAVTDKGSSSATADAVVDCNHGTWNVTKGLCDCDDGWVTDVEQDILAGETTWCMVKYVGSPGRRDGGGKQPTASQPGQPGLPTIPGLPRLNGELTRAAPVSVTAIVGVVVGGSVAVLLLGCALYFFCCHERHSRRRRHCGGSNCSSGSEGGVDHAPLTAGAMDGRGMGVYTASLPLYVGSNGDNGAAVAVAGDGRGNSNNKGSEQLPPYARDAAVVHDGHKDMSHSYYSSNSSDTSNGGSRDGAGNGVAVVTPPTTTAMSTALVAPSTQRPTFVRVAGVSRAAPPPPPPPQQQQWPRTTTAMPRSTLPFGGDDDDEEDNNTTAVRVVCPRGHYDNDNRDEYGGHKSGTGAYRAVRYVYAQRPLLTRVLTRPHRGANASSNSANNHNNDNNSYYYYYDDSDERADNVFVRRDDVVPPRRPVTRLLLTDGSNGAAAAAAHHRRHDNDGDDDDNNSEGNDARVRRDRLPVVLCITEQRNTRSGAVVVNDNNSTVYNDVDSDADDERGVYVVRNKAAATHNVVTSVSALHMQHVG